MTTLANRALMLSACLCMCLAAPHASSHPCRSAQEPASISGLTWPRYMHAEGNLVTVYQPQLESFEGVDLVARAAVSVTPKGEQAPVFGAVWFEAKVQTDRTARTVTIERVSVTDAKFPQAEPAQLEKFSSMLTGKLGGWNPTFSLDRLLTMLETVEMEQRQGAAGLKDDPPKILFVTHAALLVTIDGEPRLEAIEGSKVMRVVNTPYLMLFDPASRSYFLGDGREWLSSREVAGPWKDAPEPPAAVTELVPSESDAPQLSEGAKKPEIIVATEPTELISTDGDPAMTPIGSTGLLYVANTDSDLFVEIESQRAFVLISGRWYAASSLQAVDWSFVGPDELPADFAEIPPGSAKGEVRASVGGTQEAVDAVHETYIPQTAAIDPKTATLEVTYDGEPEFEPIAGTFMSYGVNTANSIVFSEQRYYCCHEAVWFVAPKPEGPWVVAAAVPDEIYEIPPSCPVYSVTYVHVYEATPSYVYVGYLPGYYGCYVRHGVVVYGSGWYYRPWYRGVYYARPATWGFAFRYNPYTGGWGVRIGYRGGAGGVVIGYGGGWWGAGGRRYAKYEGSRTVETPMGTFHRETSAERKFGKTEIDSKTTFTPNENIYDRAENRERNRELADRGAERPADRERLDPGYRATGPAAGRRDNDVYADRDGKVHRRSEQGWQERQGDGWSAPSERPSTQPNQRPAPERQPERRDRSSRSTPDRSNLESHHNSRQRGTQRTNNYQSRASPPRGRAGGRRGR